MRRMNSSAQFLLLTLAVMAAIGAATITSRNLHIWTKKSPTIIVQQEEKEMVTVVVAKKALRYGTVLTGNNLREIEWPKEAYPTGSVQSIEALLNQKGKAVALSYMAVGEPVLKWKVTGPGQRASLSAMLHEGAKAVSIRVNAVLGVGGFVLPGDRVDVLLTREEEEIVGKRTVSRSFTDVLLQNIRVLAVDQISDDKNDKPSPAKTVTVEVEIRDAQKLVLASSVGTLSLTLRRAGGMLTDNTHRITLADLTMGGRIHQKKSDAKTTTRPPKNAASIISVTRAMERSEYSVHRE